MLLHDDDGPHHSPHRCNLSMRQQDSDSEEEDLPILWGRAPPHQDPHQRGERRRPVVAKKKEAIININISKILIGKLGAGSICIALAWGGEHVEVGERTWITIVAVSTILLSKFLKTSSNQHPASPASSIQHPASARRKWQVTRIKNQGSRWQGSIKIKVNTTRIECRCAWWYQSWYRETKKQRS